MTPSPSPPSSPVLGCGSLIEGRYELVECIGRGGFASVYRARQLHIEREVAVKLLDVIPGAPHPQRREARFLREAKIAARVQHPNAVAIHDFGFAGSLRQPYLVMELLGGRDLDAELRAHGPIAPERALRLCHGALAALALGHQLGIVHKDLKPSNLFVDQPGSQNESLRVLDFGIARYAALGGERLTDSATPMGTSQYLAPEYIAAQHVSPAIDVYQMGLILVEMLTAVPVVRADSPYQCIILHSEGKLALPGWIERSPLGPVLRDALAKDHLQRIPNAAALSARLEGIAADEICFEEECTSPQHYLPSPRPGTGELDCRTPHTDEIGPLSFVVAGSTESRRTDSEQADVSARPGGTWRWVGGLGALALVGLVLTLLLGREFEPESEKSLSPMPQSVASPERAVERSVTTAAEPGPIPLARPAALASAGLTEAPSTPPPTEQALSLESPSPTAADNVSVRVSSAPLGAAILLAGTQLGETPATLDFPSKQVVVLTLRKEGFVDGTLRFVATEESKPLPLRLSPVPKSRKPAAVPATPTTKRFTIVP